MALTEVIRDFAEGTRCRHSVCAFAKDHAGDQRMAGAAAHTSVVLPRRAGL